MNIYLTGSHGVGKTTVAKLVAERTEFATLPSVSRNSPHKHGTAEHQKYVMDKILHRAKYHDQTIQDRTALDVYAYTCMMDIDSEYDRQKMLMERFLGCLDYSGQPLFYFPIHFALESDGIRPGKGEQIEVDSIIKGILRREKVNYHTIPNATPEERLEFVLERMGQSARV